MGPLSPVQKSPASRRGGGPTPPTTWVRLRGQKSGRKRLICGSRTGPSSSGAEAGTQSHGRPSSRHTPRAGPPPPRAAAPAARSYPTVRGGRGGAGGGKGSSPAQVPLRGRGDRAARDETRGPSTGSRKRKPAPRPRAL